MGKKSNPKTYLMMSVFLLAMVLPAAGKTILVDCNAPGPVYDGSSWPTAFKYLQDGLSASSSGDEIQVADGIYKPDEESAHPSGTGDREATFQIKNGVAVKGGYAGFGQPDPDARDPNTHETILSGDLLGNDEPNFANNSQNSYHVVTGSGTDATAVLDGFTITAGNANGTDRESYGGGMFNGGSSPTVTDCTFSGNYAFLGGGMFNEDNSIPTVTNCMFSGNVAQHSSGYGSGGGMFNTQSDPNLVNCTFSNNSAEWEGGGMYNSGSNPTVSNCTFSNNSTEWEGGGMYNSGSNPTMTNCTFSGNWAKIGGGMLNENNSKPTLTNCMFSENSAHWAGGMYNFRSDPNLVNCTFNDNVAGDEGGGMKNGASSPTLTNCTFSNNSAEWGGGGMYNGGSNPTLTNCTFIHNLASDFGGGMFNSGSKPTLTNCTFSDNSADNGGGMCNGWNYSYGSDPTVTNCIFIHNLASDFGGGMLNMESNPMVTNSTFNGNRATWGGGMENESNSNLSLIGCTFKANSATMGGGAIRNHTSSPTVLNCLIVANQAQWGGGIQNENSSNPTLINCTLSSNSASFCGGILNNGSSPILTNCILWANSDDGGMRESAQIYGGIPAVNYCCIQGWTGNFGGMGNVNADPWFVEPGYRDANGVWIDGDYHLHRGSPCINAGDNSAVPPSLSTDLDGNTRIVRGTVDMGAYEDYSVPVTIYVEANAAGANNGSSWANAYNDLQDALADAIIGDEIRVAQGVYTPEGPLSGIRQASNPNPADGATGVSRTAYLSWTADSDATSHDVYFGTSSPPPFAYNQTTTTFDPGTMAYSTTYYWRIDELSNGGKTTGTVWSFTTTSGGGPFSSPPPVGDSNEQAAPEVIDREATFQLINGVAIYGGYAGFGEPDPNARDIGLYETILSGDLNGDDGPVFSNNGENSYHVVTGTGCDQTAVLDGFIISGGNANGPISGWPDYDYSRIYGGGMYNNNGSPTVTNCTFSGNLAEGRGGGMCNHDGSSPTVTNCKFSGNHAAWGVGGGMANVSSSPILTNCTFSNNSAENGGGMSNFDSNMVLFNCMFRNNSSVREGGGMSNSRSADPVVKNCTFIGNSSIQGGAIHNYESSLKMTNCKVSGNRAKWSGGGIYVWVGFGGPFGGCFTERPGNVTLISCTFSENQAEDGRALACDSCDNQFPSNIQIASSILYDGGDEIWNNDDSTISITYSDVQGGWPNEGNIETDPRFVEPGYWDPNEVWVDGDYHLLPGSPCIDAGDPNYIAAPNETDLDGLPRVIGDRIDMGAYEFQNTPPVANAGPDQIVECACNTEEGTKVTLDGTNSSDPDRGVLTYTWTGPFVESLAHGATPTVTLEDGCPGEYVITLVVNDGIENSEPNQAVITVVDTTPPEFEFSVTPTVLWPPDHKMVEITPSWTVSDECDASPDVSLVGIVANEGDDTIGDGHTSNDIQIGEDGSIYLRSERNGTSSDRIYTITYQAIDDCGNTTVRSATVSIPHDFKVLARIAARWLWAGPGRIPEDLNSDGVVNLKDIAIFANNWIQ